MQTFLDATPMTKEMMVAVVTSGLRREQCANFVHGSARFCMSIRALFCVHLPIQRVGVPG
jgi:hypothetical protein